MAAGALLSFRILHPSHVVRDDGTHCTNSKYSNAVSTEAVEIVKLFPNWKMLLIVQLRVEQCLRCPNVGISYNGIDMFLTSGQRVLQWSAGSAVAWQVDDKRKVSLLPSLATKR
ncbi:hypothetical protein D5086_005172 [Populus alba]|uniref:Uncharacterized protein n=1 Tax=Populus alba TaxID=43335 RepID=A0ACC4CU20_POPAL